MQKIKSLNFSGVLAIIKSCLLGLIITLVGIVLFAVVLKFVDVSSAVITWVNNVIKIVSIFFVMWSVKRKAGDKLLLKAIFAGALYAILTFIIFSILNGNFAFSLAFVYDLLFAIIVAMICAVVLSLLNRKSV